MDRREGVKRLAQVPDRPGVYLFRDGQGRILYIGKATRLQERLRSYFQPPGALPDKVRRMVAQAQGFDYILTPTEEEALLLEATLIKTHQPPFNTRLRDDKSYPYIKIDLSEPFPQVYITRRVQEDGARYFGPFASAGSVRRTLALLKRLFPYRSCTKPITGQDPKPCLEYYLHRCVAPCCGYATQEEYREVIVQVIRFLEGRTEEVLADLWRRMEEASERLEFERAAVLRDQIRAIQRVTQAQAVASLRLGDLDLIALAQEGEEAQAEVFFVRNGRLVGRDSFTLEGTLEEPPGRVLAHFIAQFYSRAPLIPPRLVVPTPVEDRDLLVRWLGERRGGPVRLETPQGPEEERLLRMAEENAQEALRQRRLQDLAGEDRTAQALRSLQEALDLPRLPRRIECYDISTLRGSEAVGSMVVLENGEPKRAHYRRFRIQEVEGLDDYGMVREVLKRRFRRLAQALRAGEAPPSQAQGEAWGILPDLVLIDGGRGHLNAGLSALLEMGLHPSEVPLASLAKEEERVYVPHSPEPLLLPRDSPALLLLQRARDEAHRFALAYHRTLRSRRSVRSALDLVPGIGPKRKAMLLRRFGSLQALREASEEEIASVPGMTRALARRLKEHL